MSSKRIINKTGMVLLCLVIGFLSGIIKEYNVKAAETKTYTVMYSANRGYGVPHSQTKYHNEPLELSTTEPSRNGYKFLGWGLDATSLGIAYKPGDIYRANSDITLYAVWGKVDSSGNVDVTTVIPNVGGVNRVVAASRTVTYGSGSFKLNATATKGGTFTYTSDNKKVITVSKTGIAYIKGYGKATITIKSSKVGNYTADTTKVTITVIPKKMVLKKVTSPSKKKLKITWKTDYTVTGYELHFSPKKNFKSGTRRSYYSKRIKKIVTKSKITRKKTYYVRIRAYVNVGSKTYYGAWSKVKKVKIK